MHKAPYLTVRKGKELTVRCCLFVLYDNANEQLADDQEYEEIKEEVADECNKYGQVV